MNAVERIEAAIVKLETLKADRGYVEFNGWLAEPYITNAYQGQIGSRDDLAPITNDELLVTLHRTIDAQIDLLDAARHMKGVYREVDGEVITSRFGHGVLELANAILGDSGE